MEVIGRSEVFVRGKALFPNGTTVGKTGHSIASLSHVRVTDVRAPFAGTLNIANPFKRETELEFRGQSVTRAG